MMNVWSISVLSFVVSIAGFAVGQATVKPGQKSFARGRQLIQSNCVDCTGGSRAGMEEGIRAIEDALKVGYSNKRAAYKMLLDAYGELDTYTEKDSSAHKAYARQKSAVLKKLVEVSPKDPEVLQTYADSLQDPAEKAVVLAKIVVLNPNLTDARYELGMITAQKGKTASGIQMMEDAVAQQSDPEVLRNHVQRLINLLDEVKCPLPDAVEWNTKLNDVYDSATQGAGDPAAFSNFKKSFLEVVGKQACASAPKTD
jgi:hypothetical protein